MGSKFSEKDIVILNPVRQKINYCQLKYELLSKLSLFKLKGRKVV
jgi:hypothetical protein